MKKFYSLVGLTLLGIVALVSSTKAQITLTSTDFPAPGDKFVTGNDTAKTSVSRLSPGSKGANVTWNFSSAPLSYLDSNAVVTASASPYAAFFTAANVADTTYGTIGYNYFNVSSSAFNVIGSEQSYAGFVEPILFTPPITEFHLPATYLGTSGGTSTANVAPFPVNYGTYDSAKAIGHVMYADTVDAYGTITTPWYGPYTVLRQKEAQTSVDSLYLHLKTSGTWTFFQAQKQIIYQFTWFENGLGTAVASMATDTTFTKVSSFSWYRGKPDGVNEISQQHNTFVYPNPAKNEVNFRFTTQSNLNVFVYDITGRQVTETEMINGAAILNTSAFSNGMYLYRVTDKSGNLLDNGKFTIMQ